MFYYYMPYPAMGPGSKGTPGGAPDPSAQPVAMMPYPFPPTPYSSPLQLPCHPQQHAGARRGQVGSHGWGGVPLGSHQASPPGVSFPASPHLQMGPSSPFRGSAPRSAGAARTVPLPPRRASSADGSAAAPPTPQADRTPRTATSLGSSSASSDGEGFPARSSSMDALAAAAAAPAAPEDTHTHQQQQQQQGPAGEGKEAGSGSSSNGGGVVRTEGGASHQGAPGQRGAYRGTAERQPCAFFLKTGTCAYGDRCKFEHPYELAPHVEFNSLGLPLRPSEPDCSYYLKYKTCGFGHTCKFHHPELTELELAAAAGAAAGSPQSPFGMQFVQYPGAFPMPYGYPGAPMQGQLASGYMGPSPGAVYPPPPPHAPQPQHAAVQPVVVKQAASSAAEEPAPASPEPAASAGTMPVPITLPPAEPSAAAAGTAPQEPMSPPRPLMVFGRSKPAAE